MVFRRKTTGKIRRDFKPTGLWIRPGSEEISLGGNRVPTAQKMGRDRPFSSFLESLGPGQKYLEIGNTPNRRHVEACMRGVRVHMIDKEWELAEDVPNLSFEKRDVYSIDPQNIPEGFSDVDLAFERNVVPILLNENISYFLRLLRRSLKQGGFFHSATFPSLLGCVKDGRISVLTSQQVLENHGLKLDASRSFEVHVPLSADEADPRHVKTPFYWTEILASKQEEPREENGVFLFPLEPLRFEEIRPELEKRVGKKAADAFRKKLSKAWETAANDFERFRKALR